FTGCTVAYAHNDPAGILPWLTTSPLLIPIVEGDTHESTSSKGHPFVAWNPNDPSSYGDGSEKEKCEALYHELFHAYQDARGGTDFYTCFTAANGNTHIPVADVLATRWQNQFRVGEGLKPRPTYDGAPMPDGPCLKFVQTPKGICATPVPDKEPEPPSLGLGCGDDNGDPHLTTFDGLRYDFQAAGEFVLAHDGGFQVQVRSEPYPGSPVVAVNTAAALDMAGDRVEVDLVAGAMQLVVNGRDTALGAVTLPHGGTIAYTAPVRPTLDLTWPDGSRAEIAAISVYGLHVTVQPSPTHSGHLSGLLGDFNGATANDLVARGKTLPAQPSYDALYPGFADAWRITDATSLFTYPPGTNTATYTDRSFPRRPPATMASEAGASALCQRIGVTDPHALADCTLDVAETGQAAFADAALDSQTLLGASATPVPAPSGTGPSTSSSLGSGREATLSVTARNGNDRLTFPATAGTRVLVDILSSTVPTGCGEIHLFKPSGNEIGTGCIDGNHTGIMGGYLLDTAGTYALTLTPAGGATGSVHVRLTFSTDIHAALTPNGPMQTATIGTRGQVADYTFQGTAGQRVYVEADNSTFPHECGLPALIAPDGVKLTFGCALGNVGSIDGTLLPATGQYSVVLDPGQGGTGSVDLRLIVSQDVHTAITLGGPPVTIALTQPGQVGQASFTGTKGEKVTVAVSAATVGSECGVLRLVAPNGGALTLGCVGSDGTGSIASTTLPSPGTYVILVDPIERVTGSVTMTLKTG
ncbi:MAG TPA: VWD domain-containing protein, partial [Micromonosporaceae bacterium]